ncbi:response regulator [Caenimonas sedimenti]|nr:response regulator [Caenimonas sedimenti]
MRVVLVEDDRAMQQELARTVSALSGGRVVLVSEAARPAIEWLAEHPDGWDLAIVDMFLKEGHGFDVLRQCRRAMALPHQKAVMLSNYARDQVGRYAHALGADRFFDKSFDLDELVAYCKSLSAELAGRGREGAPS